MKNKLRKVFFSTASFLAGFFIFMGITVTFGDWLETTNYWYDTDGNEKASTDTTLGLKVREGELFTESLWNSLLGNVKDNHDEIDTINTTTIPNIETNLTTQIDTINTTLGDRITTNSNKIDSFSTDRICDESNQNCVIANKENSSLSSSCSEYDASDPYHDADINQDGDIDANERLATFYLMRMNSYKMPADLLGDGVPSTEITINSYGYKCDSNGNFVSASSETEKGQNCNGKYHDLDYSPQNYVISGSEVSRISQIENFTDKNAIIARTTETTEDGFAFFSPSCTGAISLTGNTKIAGDVKANQFCDSDGCFDFNDITNLGDRITANESNITTNTSDINTNTSNIASNAGNIFANLGRINDNTTEIDTNAAGISTNAGKIAALEANSSTDWSSITNIPDSFSDGIDDVNDADNNAGNEIQGLNFDTNTNVLTITDKSGSGATVDLSSLSDVDTTGSTINFMSEPVYLFESHSGRKSDIDNRVTITGGTIGNNNTTFTIDITNIFTNADIRKKVRGVGLSIYADSDVYLWNDLDDSTTFKNSSNSAKDIFRFAKDGDHGSSSAFIPVINNGTKVTFDMHINDGDEVALYLTHYSIGSNIDADSNPVKKMYTKDDFLAYNGKIDLEWCYTGSELKNLKEGALLWNNKWQYISNTGVWNDCEWIKGTLQENTVMLSASHSIYECLNNFNGHVVQGIGNQDFCGIDESHSGKTWTQNMIAENTHDCQTSSGTRSANLSNCKLNIDGNGCPDGWNNLEYRYHKDSSKEIKKCSECDHLSPYGLNGGGWKRGSSNYWFKCKASLLWTKEHQAMQAHDQNHVYRANMCLIDRVSCY